jgi:tRNA threonylcarbamoyladenosine biosynthesis protein TsaE
MKFISHSVEETSDLSLKFLSSLTIPPNSRATVIALYGDLGSGKTTFSQAFGRHLGITDFMTSPTFVIQKNYALKQENFSQKISPETSAKNILNFKQLIHIDAYRLEGGQELRTLGFEKLLADPENLILIEWPEKVSDILPMDSINIHFKFISENEREIIF